MYPLVNRERARCHLCTYAKSCSLSLLRFHVVSSRVWGPLIFFHLGLGEASEICRGDGEQARQAGGGDGSAPFVLGEAQRHPQRRQVVGTHSMEQGGGKGHDAMESIGHSASGYVPTHYAVSQTIPFCANRLEGGGLHGVSLCPCGRFEVQAIFGNYRHDGPQNWSRFNCFLSSYLGYRPPSQLFMVWADCEVSWCTTECSDCLWSQAMAGFEIS